MRQREPLVNRQLRLLLEQQTAAAFMGLVHGPLLGLPFTLIGYDFGPEGNVAYKTTLQRSELVLLMRGLLDRWASGETGQAVKVGAIGGRDEIIEEARLRRASDLLRSGLLPPGVGFSLLIGSRLCTAYISNAERDGVIGVLGELATAWEQEGAPNAH